MNSKKSHRVIADFNIVPMGLEETSISHYVGAVIQAIMRIKGLEIEITPMGTIMEAEDIETILNAVRIAHKTLVDKRIMRIFSTIRIDDRRDKPRNRKDKINAVEDYLHKH